MVIVAIKKIEHVFFFFFFRLCREIEMLAEKDGVRSVQINSSIHDVSRRKKFCHSLFFFGGDRIMILCGSVRIICFFTI